MGERTAMGCPCQPSSVAHVRVPACCTVSCRLAFSTPRRVVFRIGLCSECESPQADNMARIRASEIREFLAGPCCSGFDGYSVRCNVGRERVVRRPRPTLHLTRHAAPTTRNKHQHNISSSNQHQQHHQQQQQQEQQQLSAHSAANTTNYNTSRRPSRLDPTLDALALHGINAIHDFDSFLVALLARHVLDPAIHATTFSTLLCRGQSWAGAHV